MNCRECEATDLAVVDACSSDASLHLAVQQATGSKLAMFECNVAVALSLHKADQKCIKHMRKRLSVFTSHYARKKQCFSFTVPQCCLTVLFLVLSPSDDYYSDSGPPLHMIFSFGSIAVVFLIIVCCCVCPCCCLYKMCRKPRRKSPRPHSHDSNEERDLGGGQRVMYICDTESGYSF